MKDKGLTLVELISAIVIIGIVIVPFVATFANIARALFYSKARMLAANLAQEKQQIIKQMPYYRILITSSPAYISVFNPPIPYDPGYFPVENIIEGGISFTRYTYIQVASEINGKIETFPPTTPDTGMKLITTTVVWSEGSKKKYVQMKNIVSNPEMSARNALINGVVRNSITLMPIPNATVIIAENVGWQDVTDSNGNYSINVYPGSYYIVASAHGYFPVSKYISIGASQITENFNLVPMSSGTVCGYVWLNDNIVISQVVGSSFTVSGFEQEFIELFNPTSNYVYLYSGGNNLINLVYQGENDINPKNIVLNYTTTSIPPYSYYLIANTNTITLCGVSRIADAVYSEVNPDFPNIIKTPDAGAVGLKRVIDDVWIDRVGWDRNSGAKTAPFFETDGIDQHIGFQINEQYIRRTSTSNVISSIFGRCYDSGNNNVDFLDIIPIIYPVRNSSDNAIVMSGKPAIGAIVTCNDGLSGGVVSVSTGNPPMSVFMLTSVATGTWVVAISSSGYSMSISNVLVQANISTWIPNGITSPVWISTGQHHILLENISDVGYITGRVLNAAGQVISPPITVSCAGQSVLTNAQGNYFISVSSGIYNVVANPNNLNTLYVYSTKENVNVQSGRITSGVNFILSQGGRVRGFVTRDGINPIPGVVFVAQTVETFGAEGAIKGEGISDNSGRFMIVNLSSGSYYIKPVLSSRETSSPAVSTRTVTAGSLVFAGTFTVSGIMGRITGNVTISGSPIKTGVLLVASTANFLVPPTLSTATLTGVPYYLTNSYEDGSYILEVIGSTISASNRYNVRAYYTTFSGETPVISSRTVSNVTVLPGQTVSGVNFSW